MTDRPPNPVVFVARFMPGRGQRFAVVDCWTGKRYSNWTTSTAKAMEIAVDRQWEFVNDKRPKHGTDPSCPWCGGHGVVRDVIGEGEQYKPATSTGTCKACLQYE